MINPDLLLKVASYKRSRSRARSDHFDSAPVAVCVCVKMRLVGVFTQAVFFFWPVAAGTDVSPPLRGKAHLWIIN